MPGFRAVVDTNVVVAAHRSTAPDSPNREVLSTEIMAGRLSRRRGEASAFPAKYRLAIRAAVDGVLQRGEWQPHRGGEPDLAGIRADEIARADFPSQRTMQDVQRAAADIGGVAFGEHDCFLIRVIP